MFQNFDTATLVTIQDLLVPVLKTLTGFDASAFAAGNADFFNLMSSGLMDLSILFSLIGAALRDGRLSVDEINSIVTQAKTLPLAIEAITARLNGTQTAQ